MVYYKNGLAYVYGSGGYGSNLYSADQTQGQIGSPPGNPNNGGSLVNTGSAALLITAVAVVILIAALIASRKRKAKP
jgi:hypothetical protein